MRVVVPTVLAGALAPAGTIVFTYPTGWNKGSFTLNRRHRIVSNGVVYRAPLNFTASFGDTQATLTSVDMTLPAGTELRIELDAIGGENADVLLRNYPGGPLRNAARVDMVLANLGNPVATDRDGICAAQVRTGAGVLSINGTGNGTADGVWTADVPRAVTVYSGGDISSVVFTIKGYRNGVYIERTVTGVSTSTVATTATFDKVTEVYASATIGTNCEVGWNDVIGVPVRIAGTGCVIREFQDGAAPTAGTVVAGVNVSSATAGDPLGTYDPNAACDGTKTFHLLIASTDPTESGPVNYPQTAFPVNI